MIFQEKPAGLSPLPEHLTQLPSVFVRKGERDFMFHMFQWPLGEEPSVTLQPLEHSDHRWVTAKEALALELIHDLDHCIRLIKRVG